VGLACEVVELGRFDALNDPTQGGRIGQVGVVQKEFFAVDTLIVDLVIESRALHGAAAANDPVDFVSFAK
jgi:hypothetical protein